ncbi:hypothetical protein P153DRAFT_320023 [Dothidotthia symphoricarpi CBS 119687]|uniref:Heterokaryon incompatibility domain-containing protein n=1 Tax=Dothidotthia symphoricarpi CBS 119687 TaxID=1392245 RepID=A0A6A6A6X3_9PLEO|nr:uncharacterized protein P153DRAFT_320023 [Dothidotthia symphoricarpi CBS 119687]KAF2127649.1 hypothetical protein P153DRAFT_320023 [Dothidotthia symphoricarpi CBS 119687]
MLKVPLNIENMDHARYPSETQKLEYTPLEPRSIRVLQLRPGPRSARLCGDFRVISLDDEAFSNQYSEHDLRWSNDGVLDFFGEPKLVLDNELESVFYEALSYMWGDPAPVDTVLISGRVLPIAANLATALYQLRYIDRPLSIWCDAICISQDDLDERAEQVQLMRRVYQQADCVRIWINDPTVDKTSAGIAALQNYRNASDDHVEGLGSDPSLWDHVVPIFENPYWNRAWIQQEVLNARRIELHCVDIIVPGDSLVKFQVACRLQSDAVLFWSKKDDWMNLLRSLQIYITPAAHDMGEYVDGARFWSLIEIIDRCKRLDMTDGRDRVYAVMHLARDYEDGGMVVDYHKSETEIMVGAIAYHVGQNQHLRFLHESFLGQDDTPRDIPTWLPRQWLGMEENSRSLFDLEIGAMDTQCSSHSISAQEMRLRARGFRVDSVQQSLTNGLSAYDMSTIQFWSSPFANYLLDSSGLIIKTLSQELYKILTHRSSWEERPTYDAVVSALSVFFELTQDERSANRELGWRATGVADLLTDTDDMVRLALEDIVGGLSRRMVIMTENQLFGLIPRCEVQEGDEIWVLLGCSLHVILRPKNGVYWHVCTAYIPNFLEHAAIKDLSSDIQPGDKIGDWTVTDIELE